MQLIYKNHRPSQTNNDAKSVFGSVNKPQERRRTKTSPYNEYCIACYL